MKHILVTGLVLSSALMGMGVVSAHDMGKGTPSERPYPAIMAEHRELMKSITTSTELIPNGVKITHTSENSAAITKIKEMLAKMTTQRHAHMEQKGITHTITDIPNGITITITSTDPDVVKRLQAKKGIPGHGGKKHGPRGKAPFLQKSESTSN